LSNRQRSCETRTPNFDQNGTLGSAERRTPAGFLDVRTRQGS